MTRGKSSLTKRDLDTDVTRTSSCSDWGHLIKSPRFSGLSSNTNVTFYCNCSNAPLHNFNAPIRLFTRQRPSESSYRPLGMVPPTLKITNLNWSAWLQCHLLNPLEPRRPNANCLGSIFPSQRTSAQVQSDHWWQTANGSLKPRPKSVTMFSRVMGL